LLLTLGLAILVLIMPLVMIVVLLIVQFPKQAGPDAIGTLNKHWADTSRANIFMADPAERGTEIGI